MYILVDQQWNENIKIKELRETIEALKMNNLRTHFNHFSQLCMVTLLALALSVPSLAAPGDPASANKPEPISVSASTNLWELITRDFQFDESKLASNPAVQKQLVRFASQKKQVEYLFNKATPYLYYIYTQTSARGMPSEFVLLPIVESAFNPYAYSPVGASGIWQMMPATASSYGLDINWWYDSRRDIITSTDAALDYLTRLHKMFNDWELAIASYNTGQGNVRSAIKRNQRAGKPIDFWSLDLASETEAYVPKLIALAIIAKNPERYGIKLPFVPAKPYLSIVTLKSQHDLGTIYKLSGVPVKTIRRLNPGIRRWATSPEGNFQLLLPTANAKRLLHNLPRIAGKRKRNWQYHEVRKKESLAKIARNYRTSTTILKQINGLKSNDVRLYQGILVPINLNKRYTTKVALRTPTLGEGMSKLAYYKKAKDHAISSKTITASEILSGNALPVAMVQAISNPAIQMPTHAVQHLAAKSEPLASEPLNKNDSFKTLLAKIYGEQ